MRCERYTAFLVLLMILITPLSVATGVVVPSGEGEDIDLGIVVNGRRGVTFSEKVLINVSVSSSGLDPTNHTLVYRSYPVNKKAEAENTTLNLTSLNTNMSLSDTIDPLPGENRECRTDVTIQNKTNKTIAAATATYFASEFTLNVDPKMKIGPGSITESQFIHKAEGGKDPITTSIAQRVYDGLDGFIHEEDKEAKAHIKLVLNEEDGEKKIFSRVMELPTEAGETGSTTIKLNLLPNRTRSVKINLLGVLEMENKYGIGPLKLGMGGNSIYGASTVSYDYSRNFSAAVPFIKRPFIMYSGDQVLRAEEGIQMLTSRPATYNYPRIFDELMEWNRDVQPYSLPVMGENRIGSKMKGWVRILPQPMIVGYNHSYIPTQSKLRVIGDVPSKILKELKVEGLRLNDSFEGEERNIANFSRKKANQNRLSTACVLEEGEHSLRIYAETSKGTISIYKQKFYAYSGRPDDVEFIESRALGSLFTKLNSSTKIRERGWGVKSMNNNDNVEIDNNIAKMSDIKEVVKAPSEEAPAQSPYGGMIQQNTHKTVSHYTFAVCNIYRPYPFFSYALVRRSPSYWTEVSTSDGEVQKTLSSPAYDFDLRGVFGEEYKMKKHGFEKGATIEEIREKFDEGYDYLSIRKQIPDLNARMDKHVYDTGDTAVLTVNISVPGWESSDLEGHKIYVEGLGQKETLVLNESGEARHKFRVEHGGSLTLRYEGHQYLVSEKKTNVQVLTGTDSPLLRSIIRGTGVVMMLLVAMIFVAAYANVFSSKGERWDPIEFLKQFFGG